MNRPINLDLTSLKYPPMAIVSILHRLSGILLFLLMPIMLYLLHGALASEFFFQELQLKFSVKLVLWLFSSSLAFHVVAGIRHLIMDAGFAESLNAGRKGSIMVMVIAFILIILLGIWIW